ncbi:hypothetical protein [Iningainema tapete]|nr:hypothetical protein [Iningainema tapete]
MKPVAVALLQQARVIQGIPIAPEWVAKTSAALCRVFVTLQLNYR